MVDPRVMRIARMLVDATNVKKGERVQIETMPLGADLAQETFKLCLQRGAHPRLRAGLPGTAYIFYKHAQKHQLQHVAPYEMQELKQTDAIIAIEADRNTRELSNITPKKMAMYSKARQKLSDYMIKHVRWVICTYPTPSLAQEADMAVEEYRDFVFDAMSIPSSGILPKLKKLRTLMNKTKEVHLVGRNTELRFSIKGMKAIAEYATHNIPDGEVFTAPIRTSVEGHIEFSYPAIYDGVEVDGVVLHFRKGKVVNATATKNQKYLRQMINMDGGSNYLGEFGIGMNHKITKFTKNMLFDEKMIGTIHLALGIAYPECVTQKGLANMKSALHWDMLKDFRNDPAGKIFFDGQLIQKKGKFVVKL